MKYLRYLFLLMALFSGHFVFAQYNAQIASNKVYSDTLDVIHTQIQLKLDSINTAHIKASVTLQIRAKVLGLQELKLDLYKFQIDSVIFNGSPKSYSYSDSLLKIQTGNLNVNQTNTLRIVYHGLPSQDPTGWGGVYNTQGYFFNLGVGFGVDPHSFGRSLFPCLDNFVERSTYSFEIICPSGHKAFCNGALTDSSTIGNYWTWKYSLAESIPSYLVGIAIANYSTYRDSLQTPSGKLPIRVAVPTAQWSNLIASFQNLKPAIQTFSQHFGPYRFENVGYSLVPFNGGAMEHAGNIAYPLSSVDGTLSDETLFAHELSHHWWGNLITCESDSDMWINEGWASYCERLFLENVYGKFAYQKSIKDLQYEVLQSAHIRDGGYWPVSGLGHNVVYGAHAYKKGASVAHTLRSYLGDSVFFQCAKALLQRYSFSNLNSRQFATFIDSLTQSSIGTRFFRDWVFRPGFTHFYLEPIQWNPTNSTWSFNLKQNTSHNIQLADSVPIELHIWLSNGNDIRLPLMGRSASQTLHQVLPSAPIFWRLDPDNKLSDAITDTLFWAKGISSLSLPQVKCVLQPTVNPDSSKVLIEHHWAAPTGQFPAQVVPSSRRYWRIAGQWPAAFLSSARLSYDGSSTLTGFLDDDLLTGSEDSLLLLYRPSPDSTWQVCTFANRNTGGRWDKRGEFVVHDFRQGEYCLAMGDPVLSSSNIKNEPFLEVFPNPGSGRFNLRSEEEILQISITDSLGKPVPFTWKNSEINLNNETEGNYFFIFALKSGKHITRKIIVRK